MQQVKVYRVGERKVTALVVGKTDAGDLAGLKNSVMEKLSKVITNIPYSFSV